MSSPAFHRLREVLETCTDNVSVSIDEEGHYSLDVASTVPGSTGTQGPAKPSFFGSVRAGKSGVAVHLMPIYENPALLAGVDPALLRRLSGKSCFKFAKPPTDEEVVALEVLVRAATAERNVAGHRLP